MSKEKTNQDEQIKEQKSALEANLRFYNQGRSVPTDALKEIRAGRLKGMTDINPMWRMKRLTEIFGPVGFGWKYTIDRQWAETYGADVKVFCNISLYVRDPKRANGVRQFPALAALPLYPLRAKGHMSTTRRTKWHSPMHSPLR